MHRFARDDARRLHFDAAAGGADDRTFAVDRIAEAVDHAAQQALADGHVDDRAGALDGVAFLDAAVVAEDDDADIVGFQVQRHAADAAGEFHHLTGLHFVEAIDAGDAVAHRQDLADLGHVGLGAKVLDLLLQDSGDFRGADFHYPTPFMASWRRCSLDFSELSTMRLPTLTIMPPIRAGSTLTSRETLPPTARRMRFNECCLLLVVQRLGGGDLGADLAAAARQLGQKGFDHVGQSEQPAVRGDEGDEALAEFAETGAGGDGRHGLALGVPGNHRRAQQLLQIGAAADHGAQARQVGCDLVHLFLLVGEFK